jgi:hypothetical protein
MILAVEERYWRFPGPANKTDDEIGRDGPEKDQTSIAFKRQVIFGCADNLKQQRTTAATAIRASNTARSITPTIVPQKWSCAENGIPDCIAAEIVYLN